MAPELATVSGQGVEHKTLTKLGGLAAFGFARNAQRASLSLSLSTVYSIIMAHFDTPTKSRIIERFETVKDIEKIVGHELILQKLDFVGEKFSTSKQSASNVIQRKELC